MTAHGTTWIDGPLLGFDTETTGIDVGTDRIVTAALVHRSAAGTHVRTWLIDPGIEIPEAASAIHGVTTQEARERGEQPEVALEQIAAQIAAAVREGVPIVAFNATFDLCLLDAELRRHHLATLPQRLGGELVGVIDPLVLDRSEDRFRRGKRKLVDLCGVYGVLDSGRLHTADVDVLATLDVLTAMGHRYPHLGQMDLAGLHRYQIEAHRRWAQGFNEWRRNRGLPGPGAGEQWLVDTRGASTRRG
ncbi:MAG: exonuclease domain-containing protein [Cellulomonadaceae bacterium]